MHLKQSLQKLSQTPMQLRQNSAKACVLYVIFLGFLNLLIVPIYTNIYMGHLKGTDNQKNNYNSGKLAEDFQYSLFCGFIYGRGS